MSMAIGDIDGPIPPDMSHLRPAYLGLHLAGGHIALPVIIATCFLSRSTSHHPMLVNLFCTWVLYSICCSLTSYTGNAHDASPALCHFQSAVLHGVFPMCATSCLIVVLQIWWMFRQPELPQNRAIRTCRGAMVVKLALPYIVFIIYTVVTATLQFMHPSYVHAVNGLYCTYYKNPFRRFGTTSYSIVCVLLILVFEAAIAIRYFSMAHKISSEFPLADGRSTSPMVVLRLTLFTVYCIISFGAGVVFVSYRPLQTWPFMVQAGVPLLIAIVFGTSKEIYTPWCFWKKRRKMDTSQPSEGRNSSSGGLNVSEGQVGASSDSVLLIRTWTPMTPIGALQASV
ncbi:hypothetical protein FA13DRAFT_415260 [Coprinellus micaceus]|uniref:G-protein coupled receptors family 1 profile domain-containing protein n=1 Tax=Coprinellus micaceus TaxID=71717 RepID=A0A4Y7TY08_COPMI|nr:hypothetical protein FA13DRAFT_415260 [Coprinellus micaceus]